MILALALACMQTTVAVCKGPVTAVAFSTDGALYVAGDAVVAHIDASGKVLHTLDTGMPKVTGLAIRVSGDILVVGGNPAQGGAGRWVPRDLGLSRDADVVHADMATASAVAGEFGRATGGADGFVAYRAGRKSLDLRGHSGPVLALSLTGSTLISAGRDRTIRVWSLEKGDLVRTLTNHTGSVNALAYLGAPNDQPTWASASDDRTIRIWQPLIGRMVRILRGAEGPLLAVADAGNDRLVSGGQEGIVRLQDSATGEVKATWEYTGQWVHSLAVFDGRMAVGLSNGTVHVVNLPK